MTNEFWRSFLGTIRRTSPQAEGMKQKPSKRHRVTHDVQQYNAVACVSEVFRKIQRTEIKKGRRSRRNTPTGRRVFVSKLCFRRKLNHS
jgi:hypothetical protein